MSDDRRPTAFRLDPEATDKPVEPAMPRQPRAIPHDAAMIPAEPDAFDLTELAKAEPPPLAPRRRRLRWRSVFLGAFGLLLALAVSLWVDSLIRELFARADWLGWIAAGLAALALLSLVVMLLREAVALSRLASVEKMRAQASAAIAGDDASAARDVVSALLALFSSRAETAAGRRALSAQEGEVVDGIDLIRLAETALLGPLDDRARLMILDAAKRVSLITAVSPRALVDIAYVLFESGRLIRRLSELYGARPGTLGFLRLTRSVLSHLAVTGSIAAGDSLVQQIVGHGLAARLSARLGEGVVNGMMTARIGVAAIEAVRPLPFVVLKRPGMRDFLSALTAFSTKSEEQDGNAQRRL